MYSTCAATSEFVCMHETAAGMRIHAYSYIYTYIIYAGPISDPSSANNRIILSIQSSNVRVYVHAGDSRLYT